MPIRTEETLSIFNVVGGFECTYPRYFIKAMELIGDFGNCSTYNGLIEKSISTMLMSESFGD
jgi:hypothetical protein